MQGSMFAPKSPVNLTPLIGILYSPPPHSKIANVLKTISLLELLWQLFKQVSHCNNISMLS